MVDRLPEPQAHPRPRPRRHRLVGTISSAGCASGDRFVVGSWSASPIGAFTDVFWASPDGERVLLVGTERVAPFVSAVYVFDCWTQARFGFTKPPRTPAMVRVRPVLFDPSGRLDEVFR